MRIRSDLAFVFPGQGSQYIGMCDDLEAELVTLKYRFEVGSHFLDEDLWKLIKTGPIEMLNQTQFTQPALLATNVAFFDTWIKYGGIFPKYMAGHSLGEYAALVCAGILDYEKAMSIVVKRARLMQEAVPAGVGAMAAVIGLDQKNLDDICVKISVDTGLVVECANLNTPEQIVLSGNKRAVELACDESLSSGAKKIIYLDVSIPSHCRLMEEAASKLKEELEKGICRKSDIQVIQNVDAKVHVTDAEIRENLVKQLYSPVRWTQTVKTLKEYGCTKIYECGPGKVLAGLCKRIDKKLVVGALSSLDALKNLGLQQ